MYKNYTKQYSIYSTLYKVSCMIINGDSDCDLCSKTYCNHFLRYGDHWETLATIVKSWSAVECIN